MFCAPVFFPIHWFFSLSNFVIPSKCLKTNVNEATVIALKCLWRSELTVFFRNTPQYELVSHSRLVAFDNGRWFGWICKEATSVCSGNGLHWVESSLKRPVLQLVKKFPAFYGNRRARHMSVSWAKWIPSAPRSLSRVSSLETWSVSAFSLEGARLRVASRWVTVTRLSRSVYGFSLTKILVPGQCMWELWWGESVTACALLHIRVKWKMNSGRITYRTGTWHVIETVGILHTALAWDTWSRQWAYYIPHWHETRDLDSGHITYRTGMRHVI